GLRQPSAQETRARLHQNGARRGIQGQRLNMFHSLRIFPSITARLILGLTLGTTVLWCAAAAYSTYISYQELNEAFDRALQEAGRRLLPLAADNVRGREGNDSRAIRRRSEERNEDHRNEEREEYLSYQLRDASGRIVLRAHDAPSAPYDR